MHFTIYLISFLTTILKFFRDELLLGLAMKLVSNIVFLINIKIPKLYETPTIFHFLHIFSKFNSSSKGFG